MIDYLKKHKHDEIFKRREDIYLTCLHEAKKLLSEILIPCEICNTHNFVEDYTPY